MTFRPLTRLLLCAALSFLPLGVAVRSAHAAEAGISFDFGNAHPFTGIGAQVWSNSPRPGEVATLLRDINARYVRVSLTPHIPEEELSTNMTVEQISALIDRADAPKQRENIADFRERMGKMGILPVLVVWRMPKPWTSMQNKKAGAHNKAVFADPQRIGDYANYIVAQMLYAQKLGIRAHAIELTNEPQGAWDTKFEPRDYAELVLKSRAAMDRYGLNQVRIAGPGTSLQNFDEYYSALRASGASRNIGYLSAHVYHLPAQLMDQGTPGVQSFLGKGGAGPIMITEFGMKQHIGDREANIEAGDLDVNTPEHGIASVSSSLILLGKGASSVIYWQVEDPEWTKKFHGMISQSGQRRPVAHALQTAFSRVPNESTVTVAGQGAPQGVVTEAFSGDGKLAVVMVNESPEPRRITAKFNGLQRMPASVESAEMYVSGGSPKASLQGASLANGVLETTVPGRAVASIVMH